ncbi:MAG: hypothetical protein A2931_03055 [Candidatus Niyogibacteria bacterium RIFCSPLOWO2_01_FULL_45_48]|uniref:UDP-N-acetylmuramate--L-alanine ligase n=2 Tax=Candidatus Niyogiibacteriota TaxID=1817912 RepID=A0A1G2EWJ6_9BACT|nr:MAG: hypothetical protein A3J00_03695 [Candidatus Niyogibacteria bacterium RIFCSPLOWO2_02_FULL_45_13]OGZ30144.1 MAG: hypothetical protein A2931_03055 [Candidatus Niyogibacteria bacterium RIFCSPLOWO2_01_FULL_45_48]
MDKFNEKRIHMVGIKGVGMTALCELLLSYGASISGSDIGEEFHTDRVLERLNVKPLNFDADNITSDIDLIIYSSAYGEDNTERKKATELNITQMSYAEALAEVFNQKKGIMIAGSHGKTTTTALLGQIMISAGFDPTVIVGGTVIAWDSNFRAGKSEWMVVEGDEYQNKFLNFRPEYLLITNIDYDHPDTFPDRESYQEAFRKLAAQTSKKVLGNFRNRVLKMPQNSVSEIPPVWEPSPSPYLLGEHNQKNLALVLEFCREIGIADEKIRKGLSEFSGVRRRMEIYVQTEKLIIIDDYAHHPAEISATLSALKNNWPEYKITVIFQPHTFSRTKVLLSEFAGAFKDADEVYLAPTYSSAREGINTEGKNLEKSLFNELKKRHEAVEVFSKWEKGDKRVKGDKRIIITMGAGDIWQFARKMAKIGHEF